MENSADISGLVAAWGRGDQVALEHLMTFLYPELRRIARRHLNHRPMGDTLESGALANEAYLKLIRARGIQCESRVHFLALCSQVIRRILVDHARKRGYDKRGGDAMRTTLNDGMGATQPLQIELLALDHALQSLAKIDARKSRVVELRYFGGLTLGEAAEVLGISVETAKRDWRMAKAWLFGALSS